MSSVNPFRPRLGAAAPAYAVDADPVTAALQRAGRGDESAFGDFYDLVAPLVYGVVLKVVRDPAIAEEVTQDVFVELWRLAPQFESGRGSAKGWTATIAHRRAVDRVRSEQARRSREQRDHDMGVDTSADTTSEVVIELSESSQVRVALAGLTDSQREAITLAYYGGRTYREVAVLLDIPEGTAKTRIRDGLTRLRAELGEDP